MATAEASIIKWINSFIYLGVEVSNLKELSDGVIFFKILNEISPQIWQESEMKLEDPESDMDKINNVEHVFNGIREFYKTKLLNELPSDEVDINTIAVNENKHEIIRLCELVIGVVVQCEEKDEYIGAILNLDEDTQSDLMKIIQRNMVGTSRNESSIGGDEDTRSLNDQSLSEDNMSTSMTINFETQQQLDKLKKQNQTLKNKLGAVEDENGQLKNQVAKLTIENKELYDDLDIERKMPKKDASTNEKVEEVMHKLEIAERELEQKKFDNNTQAKQIKVLEDKITEMRLNQNDEKDKLMEEIEELSNKVRKLEQVEAINELYKKKLEETTDFKSRIRDLEEQNENLLSQLDGNHHNL